MFQFYYMLYSFHGHVFPMAISNSGSIFRTMQCILHMDTKCGGTWFESLDLPDTLSQTLSQHDLPLFSFAVHIHDCINGKFEFTCTSSPNTCSDVIQSVNINIFVDHLF